eukprot:gnl/MRDRNA2_/MRDRNA2_65610_c0_seq2.p1 gnl/MRDRNA2_/MRDRNA2_65610_c0~~gnl/MRDRNA2_/MRDRNA2_65610_c0_seq2.p1  ORF type:complete len:132 (+),score=18.83 gnl/MRDRNA2_/MRDRNA2_65610_c0_seq2:106-501(+)
MLLTYLPLLFWGRFLQELSSLRLQRHSHISEWRPFAAAKKYVRWKRQIRVVKRIQSVATQLLEEDIAEIFSVRDQRDVMFGRELPRIYLVLPPILVILQVIGLGAMAKMVVATLAVTIAARLILSDGRRES